MLVSIDGEFPVAQAKSRSFTPQMVSTLLAKIVTSGKDTIAQSMTNVWLRLFAVACQGKRMTWIESTVKRWIAPPITWHVWTWFCMAWTSQVWYQARRHAQASAARRKRDAIVANPPFSAKWSADPLLLKMSASQTANLRPRPKPTWPLSSICYIT